VRCFLPAEPQSGAPALDVTIQLYYAEGDVPARRLLVHLRDASEQTEIARALQSFVARYQILADSVPVFIFSLSPDGKWEYANQQFLDYVGVETSARLDWDVFENPRVAQLLQRRLRRSRVSSVKVRLRLKGKDGEARWFLLKMQFVENNGVASWLGIATDIDDLRRDAQRITELDQRFHRAMEEISECHVVVGNDGVVRRMNEQARRWLEPVVGKIAGANVFRWEHVPFGLGPSLEAAAKGRRVLHTRMFESKVRPGRWVQVHALPLSDGLNIFFHDVTDQVGSARAALNPPWTLCLYTPCCSLRTTRS
jgi:PAS domain S-box-containing protein